MRASVRIGVASGISADQIGNDTAPVVASPPNYQAQGSVVVAAAGAALGPVIWPAHEAGDIGILVVAGCHGTGNAYAVPAGWTQLASSPQTNSGSSLLARLQVFFRRATSGAESDATVADVAGDDSKLGQIITFRGCIASGSPIDVTAGDTSAASTSVIIPGATTTGAQRLVIAIASYSQIDTATPQFSAGANATLTDFAERQDFASTSSVGYGFAVFTGVKASAGAYGTTTATLGASQTQARISLALIPD